MKLFYLYFSIYTRRDNNYKFPCIFDSSRRNLETIQNIRLISSPHTHTHIPNKTRNEIRRNLIDSHSINIHPNSSVEEEIRTTPFSTCPKCWKGEKDGGKDGESFRSGLQERPITGLASPNGIAIRGSQSRFRHSFRGTCPPERVQDKRRPLIARRKTDVCLSMTFHANRAK